jgi:hypothetical protein
MAIRGVLSLVGHTAPLPSGRGGVPYSLTPLPHSHTHAGSSPPSSPLAAWLALCLVFCRGGPLVPPGAGAVSTMPPFLFNILLNLEKTGARASEIAPEDYGVKVACLVCVMERKRPNKQAAPQPVIELIKAHRYQLNISLLPRYQANTIHIPLPSPYQVQTCLQPSLLLYNLLALMHDQLLI